MYRISWDYVDEQGFVHQNNKVDFDNKDEANDQWVAMKNSGIYLNMEATVVDDKYIAITVTFQNYSKDYTYLAKKKINSKYCVVDTSEGLKVVKVKKCYETTKAELEKALPFSRYQYIKGIVKEA